MMRRSGKWYRNNEKQVMAQLGLQPTPNSGSGWIIKEDGQSEDVLCQLKSTDAQSIKVNKYDLDTLQYNAMVAHKLPVFAIQYLQSNEVYLVLKPEVLQEAAQYLNTGKYEARSGIVEELATGVQLNTDIEPARVIKSNSNARESYREELQQKYGKKKRSAT